LEVRLRSHRLPMPFSIDYLNRLKTTKVEEHGAGCMSQVNS
jgi:hypothetical protein